jgi:hypothetical protein
MSSGQHRWNAEDVTGMVAIAAPQARRGGRSRLVHFFKAAMRWLGSIQSGLTMALMGFVALLKASLLRISFPHTYVLGETLHLGLPGQTMATLSVSFSLLEHHFGTNSDWSSVASTMSRMASLSSMATGVLVTGVPRWTRIVWR